MANHKTDLEKSRKEWVINVADKYIDYLLAASGDIGEEIGQERGGPDTMKAKREFVDELVKRMFKALPGKKFGVLVEKIVSKMVSDAFLENYNEAENVLFRFNQQYKKADDVPRVSFKAFLLKFNEIFIPLEKNQIE